jgi:hypothetical protein
MSNSISILRKPTSENPYMIFRVQETRYELNVCENVIARTGIGEIQEWNVGEDSGKEFCPTPVNDLNIDECKEVALYNIKNAFNTGNCHEFRNRCNRVRKKAKTPSNYVMRIILHLSKTVKYGTGLYKFVSATATIKRKSI